MYPQCLSARETLSLETTLQHSVRPAPSLVQLYTHYSTFQLSNENKLNNTVKPLRVKLSVVSRYTVSLHPFHRFLSIIHGSDIRLSLSTCFTLCVSSETTTPVPCAHVTVREREREVTEWRRTARQLRLKCLTVIIIARAETEGVRRGEEEKSEQLP